MNKAYLLVICLLLTPFTGCLDDEDTEDWWRNRNEEKPENEEKTWRTVQNERPSVYWTFYRDFDECDPNNDSIVAYGEFFDCLNIDLMNDGEVIDGYYSLTSEFANQVFSMADLDMDGNLTSSEFDYIKNYPHFECELVPYGHCPGANLSYQDFSGMDLEGINLSYANLGRSDLSAANLNYADLTGAILNYADLNGAILENADLKYAALYGANLTDANLTGANLTGTLLERATFQYANLTNADLAYTSAWSTGLSGADLTGADLTDAYLLDADLTVADLTGVDWSRTTCPDGTNSDDNGNTCENNLI